MNPYFWGMYGGYEASNYVGPPATGLPPSSSYPSFMYNPRIPPVIVQNQAQANALVAADPNWSMSYQAPVQDGGFWGAYYRQPLYQPFVPGWSPPPPQRPNTSLINDFVQPQSQAAPWAPPPPWQNPLNTDAQTYVGPSATGLPATTSFPRWMYNPPLPPVLVINATQMSQLLALGTGWH